MMWAWIARALGKKATKAPPKCEHDWIYSFAVNQFHKRCMKCSQLVISPVAFEKLEKRNELK